MKLTEHFDLSEFKCKCGCSYHLTLKTELQKLATILELIREEFQKPLSITSGVRCPDRNKETKGAAPNSYHMKGLACDFKIKGYTGPQIARILESLIRDGIIPEGGLGVYPNRVHYDIRNSKARWKI